MNTNGKNAIKRLFAAFQDVPKPRTIEGCGDCIGQIPVEALLSKSLSDITPDELTLYASKVLLTVGSVDDFQYFLPRILEICAQEEGWWPDIEVVAGRIADAEFDKWATEKKDAVIIYFEECFRTSLSREGAGYEIDQWVCAIGNLRIGLKRFLSLLETHPKRLIEFYEANSEALQKAKLTNSF